MLTALVSLFAAASTFQPTVTQQVMAPDGLAPKLEIGVLSEPLRGELTGAAKAWGLANGARYGLPAGATLRVAEAFGTRWGGSIHLVQQLGDLDVYGAKLVITVDLDQRVVQVASSLVHPAKVRGEWAIGPAEALRRAAASVPFPALQADGTPYGGSKKALFAVGDELHAGYLTRVPSIDVRTNWYVAVDAVTGEQIFAQDRVYHGALTANVYPISPGGLDAGVGVVPTQKAELTHADGGPLVGDVCGEPLRDGGIIDVSNDGGFLCGTQLMAFNCCPSEGCSTAPDAGPRRAAGTTTVSFGGFNVNVTYDVAVCERLHRASNNPEVNDGGSFEYTPVDPPVNARVVDPADPSNSDPFAEVHAFYHVNRVYDWVRQLSATPLAGQPALAPFKMRDEKRMPPQRPAVWANVMFPNFQELQGQIPGCLAPGNTCRANTLLRLDNAAFMPVEQIAQLPLPEFATGVDTLMIFQGNSADAAYDSMVLQHEFGHGVVYATANLSLDALAVDARSANNESGALHEGFADYIAAAFNNQPEIGPYFGPRALAGTGAPVQQETFLRTLNNTYACPDVLWGEVHQDSQHVSAALWKGRVGPFIGTDNGHTFDAAFYAMLVSLAPNADFASVAAAMAAKAAVAFPAIGNASAQMTGFFTEKGVIGCSKVLDVTGATVTRPYYGISSPPATLGNSVIPGPIQFHFHVPNGVSKIDIAGAAGGGGLLAAPKAPTILVKANHPVTFAAQGQTLINDADSSGATQANAQTGALTGSLALNVPCGAAQELFVTLGAPGGGSTVQRLALTVTPLASCTPDAGTDGGTDAGQQTSTGPSIGPDGTTSGPVGQSCGCASAELGPLLGLAVLALRRRRAKQG